MKNYMKDYMKKNGIMFTSDDHDKPWVYVEGYPNFAFRYDEKSQKYAIACCELTEESVPGFEVLEGNEEVIQRVLNSVVNVERKIKINSFTEPFVDGIICSTFPLETWTAEYVVVRIDDFYYLADNKGNCYHKRANPFIICRNVFVSDDGKTIVAYGNKEVTFKADVVVKQFGHYNFAFVSDSKGNVYSEHKPYESLLDAYGKEVFVEEDYWSKRTYSLNFSEVHNWYLFYGDNVFFINREFNMIEKYWLREKSVKVISDTFKTKHLCGEKSKTYFFMTGSDCMKYSTYFNSEVVFDSFGELEIVWYNGKTYLFKPNGKIEVINGEIYRPKRSGKYIVYVIDNIVVMRDLNGEKISEEEVSPAKLYELL